MAGYYTWRRTKPSLSRPNYYFRNSNLTPNPRTHVNSLTDVEVTTSYRSKGELKDENKKFGARDPFESFYAYGSWRHDTGHPFQTDKTTHVLTHPRVYKRVVDSTYGTIILDGPIVPDYGLYGSSPLAIDPINSNYYGPFLINRAIPTNPVANVGTSLAELMREGISLPGAQFIRALQSRTGFLRSVGSEYLNIEFGWKPLISDLQDVLRAISTSRETLENLERQSGAQIRRRRTLDERIVTNTYGIMTPSRTLTNPSGGSDTIFSRLFTSRSGPLERVDRVTEQYSFSGAFTYYFENGKDPISQLRGFEQKANLLLGTRLTPEVLWELAPWSWLADWFANFGTLASNVSRFGSDGLVMKYGYLMRHSVSKRIYTQNGVSFIGGGGPGPFAITLQLERKERVRATPFGFGLNPDTFSTRQWAILAALGLTKAPRVLP